MSVLPFRCQRALRCMRGNPHDPSSRSCPAFGPRGDTWLDGSLLERGCSVSYCYMVLFRDDRVDTPRRRLQLDSEQRGWREMETPALLPFFVCWWPVSSPVHPPTAPPNTLLRLLAAPLGELARTASGAPDVHSRSCLCP